MFVFLYFQFTMYLMLFPEKKNGVEIKGIHM